jgi:hypothetical protein
VEYERIDTSHFLLSSPNTTLKSLPASDGRAATTTAPQLQIAQPQPAEE